MRLTLPNLPTLSHLFTSLVFLFLLGCGNGGLAPAQSDLSASQIRTDGACGKANGSVAESAPTANLCSSGTASAVTGSGPYIWTCTGANGGTTASCQSSLAPTNGIFIAPNGADVGSCSVAAPCLTLKYVSANFAQPGDTIYLRGGTYTQAQLYRNASGTANAPITVAPYPGEIVKFDGASIGAGTTLFTIYNVSYVNFIGPMEFTDSAPTGKATMIYLDQTKYVNFSQMTVHEAWATAISVGSDSGMAESYGALISNNLVYNHNLSNSALAINGAWGSGITVSNSQNVSVIGNTVHDGYGEGIDIYSSNGVLVKGNTSYDNFSVEIYASNDQGITVDGNLTYFTGNTKYKKNGKGPQCYGISNEIGATLQAGFLYQNNIAVACQQNLRYFISVAGGTLINSQFINNTFVNGLSANVEFDSDTGTAGNVLRNNILYQTGPGANSAGSNVGFISSYNDWFGSSAGTFAGTGDITADPLFQSPGSFVPANNALRASSPAANAGSNPAPALNFGGTARTSPSMGAW